MTDTITVLTAGARAGDGKVPTCKVVDIGFRWDGEAQHHVPRIVVEFEPVPANSPCDAKGWTDRDALVAMLAAAPAVSAPAWQPIETAPKDGRKLILFYLNRNGKARTVMARWVTDEEAAETDADGVGLEGGWYECIDNWDEYSQVTITEGEPSHWMPRPTAPSFEAPVTGDAA